MSKKPKIATIFGCTGFVGRQIVRELASRGYVIKAATRIPESAYFLRPAGNVGQVVPLACDYSEQSIKKAVKDSDVVVNCIGILFQRGRRSTFQRAHIDIPTTIAKACKTHKVKSFVHISALGIDESNSKYAHSKLAGEEAIRKAYDNVTILRPSVIFGEDDNFFNMFAHLARFLPFLPLIGGGQTKFQPVFVGDVADAAIKTIESPKKAGQTYELGGPDIVTFKEIYAKLFHYTARSRPLVPLPFFFAKVQALFMCLLPTPLLTPDQVESLKTHTIVNKDALGFQDLGIKPTSMDLILPQYLETYRSGGRFSDTKAA